MANQIDVAALLATYDQQASQLRQTVVSALSAAKALQDHNTALAGQLKDNTEQLSAYHVQHDELKRQMRAQRLETESLKNAPSMEIECERQIIRQETPRKSISARGKASDRETKILVARQLKTGMSKLRNDYETEVDVPDEATQAAQIGALRKLTHGDPMTETVAYQLRPHIWVLTAIAQEGQAQCGEEPSSDALLETADLNEAMSYLQPLAIGQDCSPTRKRVRSSTEEQPNGDTISDGNEVLEDLDPRILRMSQGARKRARLSLQRSLGFTRRKPICVRCWVKSAFCDFNAQCGSCIRAGTQCVRKLCQLDENCTSSRCPCLHIGEWTESDDRWIVETGILPVKEGRR